LHAADTELGGGCRLPRCVPLAAVSNKGRVNQHLKLVCIEETRIITKLKDTGKDSLFVVSVLLFSADKKYEVDTKYNQAKYFLSPLHGYLLLAVCVCVRARAK